MRRHRGNINNLSLPEDCASFDLDKAWLEIHLALRQMRAPVNRALRGDRTIYGALEGGVLEVPEDEHGPDAFIGLATPGLVKKIDKALASLTGQRLVSLIKKDGWEVDSHRRDYYARCLKELKSAYRTAAKQDSYLQVFIG